MPDHSRGAGRLLVPALLKWPGPALWPWRAPEALEGSGVGTRGHAMQGGPDGVCGAPRLAALMAGRKSRALGAEGCTPEVTPCLCPGDASTADQVRGVAVLFLLLRRMTLESSVWAQSMSIGGGVLVSQVYWGHACHRPRCPDSSPPPQHTMPATRAAPPVSCNTICLITQGPRDAEPASVCLLEALGPR